MQPKFLETLQKFFAAGAVLSIPGFIYIFYKVQPAFAPFTVFYPDGTTRVVEPELADVIPWLPTVICRTYPKTINESFDPNFTFQFTGLFQYFSFRSLSKSRREIGFGIGSSFFYFGYFCVSGYLKSPHSYAGLKYGVLYTTMGLAVLLIPIPVLAIIEADVLPSIIIALIVVAPAGLFIAYALIKTWE